MKIIKELSEMIEEELEGAEHYIEKANHLKESNPSLARVFYEISLQEMNHVNLLHGEVVKLIEQHRKEHGEPPAAMLAVYDYLHEKHIKAANRIKMYQGQYRGE
jgi:ferritin